MSFTDPPVAVSTGSDRIDLFARGVDSKLYQKWWDGKKWNPSATGWGKYVPTPQYDVFLSILVF